MPQRLWIPLVDPPSSRPARYAAIGSGGQVILVAPDRRLIVVASSYVVGPDQGGNAIFRLIDLAVVPNLP